MELPPEIAQNDFVRQLVQHFSQWQNEQWQQNNMFVIRAWLDAHAYHHHCLASLSMPAEDEVNMP